MNRGHTASGDATFTTNYGDNFRAGEYAGGEASGNNNFYGSPYTGYGASGDYNFYSCYNAGHDSSGSFNFYGGCEVGNLAAGSYNAYLGNEAGNHASGDGNVYAGYHVGVSAVTTNSMFLGSFAGRNATGDYWLFMDVYPTDPGPGYNPTNDSIVIDGNTTNLYLGRPTGTVNLRGTVTGSTANMSGCPSGAVATNNANYLKIANTITNNQASPNFTTSLTIDGQAVLTNTAAFGVSSIINGATTNTGAITFAGSRVSATAGVVAFTNIEYVGNTIAPAASIFEYVWYGPRSENIQLLSAWASSDPYQTTYSIVYRPTNALWRSSISVNKANIQADPTGAYVTSFTDPVIPSNNWWGIRVESATDPRTTAFSFSLKIGY
jgi:hypothetical protein